MRLLRLRLSKRTGASHWQGNPDDRNWFHQWGQVTTEGRIVFRLDWLRGKPFTEANAIQELLTRIASIPGVQLPTQQPIKRIRISLSSLDTPNATERLHAVLSWLISQVKQDAQ